MAFGTETPTAAKLDAMSQAALACIRGATHYCMPSNKPANYKAYIYELREAFAATASGRKLRCRYQKWEERHLEVVLEVHSRIRFSWAIPHNGSCAPSMTQKWVLKATALSRIKGWRLGVIVGANGSQMEIPLDHTIWISQS